MAKGKKTYQARRKKNIKIVFWFLTIALSVGLVGSSVMWSMGGSNSSTKQNTAGQQQAVDQKQIIKDLEAKVKANPKDTAVLNQLAAAYEMNDQRDKALETYQKIIELNPGDTETGLILVKNYYYLGRYDEAVKQAQNVLKADPDNLDAHYYYGFILGDGKQDYQGGIDQLQEYIKLAKTGKDVQVAKDMIKIWQEKLAQKQ